MFSGSSSFLGGANSARGQPQYGQSPFGQQQQQQQPQQQQPGGPAGFAPQPTGFGGGSLQPQFTGYPGQAGGYGQPQQQQPPQLQSQFTGYPGQMNQSFQQAPQQQPFQTGAPGFQQPQPTGFQQQQAQPPAQPQRPQATGMTSSQMADSFRTGSSSSQPPPIPKIASNKIPNIRLSFITATDQAKFEQLFKSAVGEGQALSGDQAKELLMRSKLSGDVLGHIWYISHLKTLMQ